MIPNALFASSCSMSTVILSAAWRAFSPGGDEGSAVVFLHKIGPLWNESWTAPIVNHLWQSTVFIAVAWLLALALRKNHARVRYWVWFAASLKFLLPFSLLIAGGEWLRSLLPAHVVARPAVASVMEQVTQPFAKVQFFDAGETPLAAHHSSLLPVVLLGIWLCGALIVAVGFVRGWLSVHAIGRAASPLNLAAGVPVLLSASPIEPGIFGIFRPVLLLPEGILDRLTPEQLQAIVAHEMCHVRRRDNLTYTIHMVVEALFWFHPAVWWIGARLIDERERACDEAVVQAGGAAENYAESILSVCKFYVESPVACVAGVTGADLKKRIVRIMAARLGAKLTFGRKLLLGAAGLAAITWPVLAGLAYARQSAAQTQAGDAVAKPLAYEAVTVKPDNTGNVYWIYTSDGFSAGATPLAAAIQSAYGLPMQEQIVGLPGWASTEPLQLQAKMGVDTVEALDKLPPRQRWEQRDLMLQSLLADHFALKVHLATKNLPIYELTVAKGGSKMKKSAIGSDVRAMYSSGKIQGVSISMKNLATNLSRMVGRVTVDKTGLEGSYDIALEFAPEGAGPSDTRPSIFAALEEQLGLKLVPAKGSVDVLVIDHIERPSPN